MSVPRPFAILIISLYLILVVGCASSPNQGSPVYYTPSPQETPRSFTTVMDDSLTLARIKTKIFSDDLVDQDGIEITVHHGVVYLSGTAQDTYHRRMVADLIRTVDGVGRIENQLRVAHRGTTFETAEGMVTQKIKLNLLQDPVIGPQPIVVETTPTKIVLSGSVKSQTQKQQAAAIAEINAGNRQVVNQISVMK